MKTIKLIDLFIKIANGEDTPNAIKFAGKIFTHNGTGLNSNYYCGETDELLEENFILNELNEEVEIIEDKPKENKKIEKYYDFLDTSSNDMKSLRSRVNELTDTLNEIIDKINGDSNERDN